MPSATNQQVIAGLYAAFFNRAPDQSGLDYWEGRALSSTNPSSVYDEIAAGFASHPVFTSTYGSMDDNAFVGQIYQNVLGRAGDAEGIAYWNTFLETHQRSEMVSTFVNSAMTVDLNSSAFDYLTAEQRTGAQMRQDLLTNKANVALGFVNTLGTHTNVTNSDNPENDPAYLASIKILSGVSEDSTTVSTATSMLNQIATNPTLSIDVINHLDSVTDDADTLNTIMDQVRFHFTEAWLSAHNTIYDVYAENDGGPMTSISVFTFNGDGTGTAADGNRSSSTTYSIDNAGILSIHMALDGSTNYIKGIQEDSAGHSLSIAWSENDYAAAANATFGSDYFFTDQSAADAFVATQNDTASSAFAFTTDWLSGRTIYDISGDENASYTNTDGPRDLINNIVSMTFNTNGTLVEHALTGDHAGASMQETWSVDANNTIVISGGPDGTWYLRASGESLGNSGNAYVVYPEDHYDYFSSNDHYMPEAIATDLATAQSLIGTILPAQNVFATW